MRRKNGAFCAGLLSGAAMYLAAISGAHAETAQFNIPPQPLDGALRAFGTQSGRAIFVDMALVRAKTSPGVSASADPEAALTQLLSGTGLSYERKGELFAIYASKAAMPKAPIETIAAAETVSGSAVEGLVVTAQKRREAIQDVPIAISAFSADTLRAQKIEGGFDLLKAIPNVTFSKNNFSGYNFSIRGIGTKAISVTTDPGVAVEFNGAPLIRNRLFEQEYFDVERVEVLRGPQGTLHGRNATAGVINVISNDADLGAFEGSLKGEVGNYHTKRLSGFVNVPLVEDVLALRFAGSLTSRYGYDYNATTQNAVNGRDLWSGRLSLGFEPTERIRADLIWERFNEDDNRSRTGKQLCRRDPGKEFIGNVPIVGSRDFGPLTTPVIRGVTSQGCLPVNLYDDSAYGTPNGLSLQAMLVGQVSFLGYTTPPFSENGQDIINDDTQVRMDPRFIVTLLRPVDPYGGMMQTRDLRVINSIRDPIYRAQADVLELNIKIDFANSLTFASQTAYNQDSYYSTQDFNRFNTQPVFNDSSSAPYQFSSGERPDGSIGAITIPSPIRTLTPGGVYCDPQLGCSDTIAGFDVSRAKSRQFNQEFRLQSSFEGPLNFNAGVNYTNYRTVEDYFVMFNLFSLLAQAQGPFTVFNNNADPTLCTTGELTQQLNGIPPGNVLNNGDPIAKGCVYIDPNPLASIDGEGHNYFRSMNPYSLHSAAAFGELYWQASDTFKVTAGLRYTDDRKTFTPVPSQLLLAEGFAAGDVHRGYPTRPDIKQKWQEFTGRVGFDWTPDLSLTDETMLYAFYSRGYKAGGSNPPGVGFSTEFALVRTLAYPQTFEPEFVNAYEIGMKNTLLGGGLVFNGGAFYYDYKGYQVSQIKDRTAVNENFDATVWGLEFESILAPSPDLRFNATLGFQDTQIADGEQSFDLMNRTAGDPNYVVLKPWIQTPSNCVVPVSLVEEYYAQFHQAPSYQVCPGFAISFYNYDDPRLPNQGQGIYTQLSGNELPNAPHWTISFGTQYEWDLFDGNWRAGARGDAYWQSQSWHRVYNLDPYDKLHGWYNANLSMWLERPADDLRIEFYVKNLLDDTPITDAFLNSDDTGLTTNVFTLDPRLIGLQITKGF